ncbi:MAG: hypothetical protein IT518_09800 [Burkholderiales bacterium]|nr:hypothetical protein [Burkholderiales bacterium]
MGDALGITGALLASVAIVDRRKRMAEENALRAQQDADTVRRGEVAYETSASALLDDPEKGLLVTRRGVNAAGLSRDVEHELTRLRSDARVGLAPELAAKLDAKLDVSAELIRRRVRGYEAAETRKAQAESLSAKLQTSVNGAVANATDPQARAVYAAQGLTTLEVAAELHGWSPEVRANEIATFATSLHTKTIDALIAADETGATAQEYFDQHRDAMNGPARTIVEEKFDQLRRAQEAEQARREAEADRLVDRVERMSLSPFPVSAEIMAEAERQVRGTPAAVRLAELQQEIEERAVFARETPAEMLRRLDHAQKVFEDEGIDDLTDVEYVKRRAEIFKATVEMLRDDPIGYATGQDIAAETALDTRSPTALLAGLRARTPVINGLRATHGAAPKVLRPAEAAALAEQFNTSTPSQQAEFLRVMEAGIDDPELFRGTVGQLASGAPLVSFAGRLAAEESLNNEPLASTGSAAALVLEGAQLLNPPKDSGAKPYPLPKASDLRYELNDITGEAFADAPEAREQIRQGVDAVYAALSAQAGDYSAILDTERYRTAVDKVTGGIIDVNGRAIVKPYAMPESEFLRTLGAVDAFDVEMLGGVAGFSNAQAAEAIRDGELVNFGGGYAIRDGGRYLLRSDGEVFVWRPSATLARQWRRGER